MLFPGTMAGMEVAACLGECYFAWENDRIGLRVRSGELEVLTETPF